MDMSKGCLVTRKIPPAQTSTPDFGVNPITPEATMLNTIPTGSMDRSLGKHNLPLGTPGRRTPSPFPDETGKRTLETGPLYER
jgi:hypothetical protein